MFKINGLHCILLMLLLCISCGEQAKRHNEQTALIPKESNDGFQSTRPAVSNEAIAILESKIIGAWVSVEDSLWKLTFKMDQTCYQYYGGAMTEKDSFKISGNSPQCGLEVTVDSVTNYLQLKDIKNGEKICYEINGITAANLSLRVIDRGGALVFRKE